MVQVQPGPQLCYTTCMKNILKQSTWLVVAQGTARLVGFLYTLFLARHLSIEDFGLFSASLAYFSLASSFADFGFNRFLIREVSINRHKLNEILFNVTILRLTFATIIFSVFAVTLYLLDPQQARVSLSILAVMAVLPQTIAFSLDAVFVALQKLQFSALGVLGLSVGTTVAGIYLVGQNYGSTGAVSAVIIGEIIYTLILFLILRVENIGFFSKSSINHFKKIIMGSLPYGLLGIMGLIYFKIDTLLLSYMRGNFETGIYSVAYRFLEAVIFIPSAVSMAIFPILSRLHEHDASSLKKIYFQSMQVMLFVGVLIFLIYQLILPFIVKWFLPQYLPAIGIINILAITIPFMFAHTPSTQLLLSTEKYLKPVIILSVVTMSFNIISNIIFIPQFGFVAAAWITVSSEILSFVVFLMYIQKKVLNERV